MQVYWEVARRGFRRYATYRAATAAGVFTNTVFGFLQAYVLRAVYRSRTQVGGFDEGEALTYVFLTQGLLAPLDAINAGADELSGRIRTGDIVTDLYRPVDLQGWWLAVNAGRAAFQVLARGIPPFAVANVLLAVYRSRTQVGGFDEVEALTYVFLTEGLLAPLDAINAGADELSGRIRTGDIVTDPYRPVDL